MLPQQLAQEVEDLQKEGQSVDLIEAEGWANIVFHSYALPPSYNKPSTELLLKFPLSYANGRPDMFWTDVDLTLKTGRTPQSAEVIETALGKQWRRFSWHPQNWNTVPTTSERTWNLSITVWQSRNRNENLQAQDNTRGF